jgi:hypothetical protein
VIGGGGTDLSLFDNFVLKVNSQTSVQLTLSSTGTYQLTVLTLTSTVTADETVEAGTFVFAGPAITFTPTEHTCGTPLAPSTDGYLINGSALVLVSATGGATAFLRAPPLSTAGLTLVVGCGTPFMPVAMTGSSPVPATPGTSPSLYGSWLLSNASVSIQFTLNPDMTYETDVLLPTSTVSGNEYIEKGTFAFQGASLNLTPTQASCPGVKPVEQNTFVFNGTALSTTSSTGSTLNFSRMAMTQLGANLTVVLGCSVNNGPWMPEALGPVTNN